MSFWHCNIERTADDKLHQEVWSFMCIRETIIVLDMYGKMERATTRHKFKAVEAHTYARYNRRRNTLPLAAVPWPDDVVAEAKQRFVDSIEVVKDN